MLSEAYSSKQFYGEKPVPGEPLSLSLVISPGAFMYAILGSGFKTVAELGHVQPARGHGFEQAAADVPFLIRNFFLHQKKFDKINIAILNQQFTLVPEAYSQDNSKTLLQFTSGAATVRSTLQHQIRDVRFCHAPDQELYGYLEKTFANAQVRHAGAVTISLLHSQHSLLNCQVFMNLHDNSLELAVKDQQHLLFYNVFTYETNEDVLYYLLFTLEQLGFDPLLTRLCIAAQRPLTDELIKSIRKYVKQVSFCAPNPSLVLSGELLPLPQHYYFTLLNQHVCEL